MLQDSYFEFPVVIDMVHGASDAAGTTHRGSFSCCMMSTSRL